MLRLEYSHLDKQIYIQRISTTDREGFSIIFYPNKKKNWDEKAGIALSLVHFFLHKPRMVMVVQMNTYAR